MHPLPSVLPGLLPLVTDPDPCLRHGALHAVSEVCGALASLARADALSFTQYVSKDITQALLQIVPRVSCARTANAGVKWSMCVCVCVCSCETQVCLKVLLGKS